MKRATTATESHTSGLQKHYVDLHIHVGRAGDYRAVKVTASPELTVASILGTCGQVKGITVAGIVDCGSPAVLQDLSELVKGGHLAEVPGGGLTDGVTTLLLGVEVETGGGEGPSHHVGYLPGLAAAFDLSRFLSTHLTNVVLSSQRADLSPSEFALAVAERGGFVIPAHVFTPYKSVFGRAATRMSDLFDPAALKTIAAVELGLSSDTEMADRLSELHSYSFVTNSDAHSNGNIAREYATMELEAPSFDAVRRALLRRGPGRVTGNFGLDPKLGKYHRTFCLRCDRRVEGVPPQLTCGRCGSAEVVRGVLDRIETLADLPPGRHPSSRPPYVYRVPLSFVPGIGPAKRSRLVEAFGSEINALEAGEKELAEVLGEKQARLVRMAQEGKMLIDEGAGGVYGRLLV